MGDGDRTVGGTDRDLAHAAKIDNFNCTDELLLMKDSSRKTVFLGSEYYLPSLAVA